MNFQDRLDSLPEGPMRQELERLDPINATEFLDAYLAASDVGKKDIEAFFESNGPKKASDSELKYNEGVPLASDLERWASE